MVLAPLMSNILADYPGIDEGLLNFMLSLGLKRRFKENKEERRVCQLNILRPQHMAFERAGSVK
jgi:hypothetical protein